MGKSGHGYMCVYTSQSASTCALRLVHFVIHASIKNVEKEKKQKIKISTKRLKFLPESLYFIKECLDSKLGVVEVHFFQQLKSTVTEF